MYCETAKILTVAAYCNSFQRNKFWYNSMASLKSISEMTKYSLRLSLVGLQITWNCLQNYFSLLHFLTRIGVLSTIISRYLVLVRTNPQSYNKGISRVRAYATVKFKRLYKKSFKFLMSLIYKLMLYSFFSYSDQICQTYERKDHHFYLGILNPNEPLIFKYKTQTTSSVFSIIFIFSLHKWFAKQ